jgi:hypothetical protein
MIFTRIRSYTCDGKFTTAEHLYLGKNQTRAITQFRREYPEHENCVIVAESYESETPENKEHFEACLRCGCVH